jgi:hypothetical protein
MINTSSKTLEAMLKTCKTFYESKPPRSRSPDAKTPTKLKPLKPRQRDG